MKIKLLLLVLFGAGVVALGVIRTASTGQKKDIPYKGRLEWYAREAKTQGQKKVTLPAPVIEYLGSAGTITAAEAFAASTVVVGHLVLKQSIAQNANVITWNKFAIDEVLSEAKDLPCPTCGPSDPPATLLPIHSGEFLLPKTGGTVDIDGVEVEQIDYEFPAFEFKQKYLLLINLYPNGTAGTVGGPVGVFRITNDEKLLPVRQSDHRILKDFKEQYKDSLEYLRRNLKPKSQSKD